MNCPNCGKEIDGNQKFCTYCGAKLTPIQEKREKTEQKTPQTSNKIKYIIKSKNFLIPFVVFTICLIMSIHVLLNTTDKQLDSYKSIIPITKQEMDKISPRSALEQLMQQEEYETLKQEQQEEEQKLIQAYNNLKIDGQEMIRIDNESSEYCSTQDVATAGQFLSCQIEYIIKKYPHLSDTYRTVYAYCTQIKNCCTADIDNCMHSIFEQH